jgi:hypothetical protein
MLTNIKLPILLAVCFTIAASSCTKDSKSSQSEDDAKLKTMMAEIKALSEKESCSNAAEWHFIAIGAKACGGPAAYIAYSEKLDTAAFTKKVRVYTKAQEDFNKKYNIASDCMAVIPPKIIICEDGKPKLVTLYP